MYGMNNIKLIYCYCSYTWAVKLIQRVFHMILPSSAGSGSSGLSSVLSGVFIAEEVDRAGENGSGEFTTLDVKQTLLEQVRSQTMSTVNVEASSAGAPMNIRLYHSLLYSLFSLELRHPRCVFKIRYGQGSQNTTIYIIYVTAELHASAYIEAIFRFILLAKSYGVWGPDVEIS
jgi:hypothetical protein